MAFKWASASIPMVRRLSKPYPRFTAAVHRLSNRLRWHGKSQTNTAEQTRISLESWLPKELHGTMHVALPS